MCILNTLRNNYICKYMIMARNGKLYNTDNRSRKKLVNSHKDTLNLDIFIYFLTFKIKMKARIIGCVCSTSVFTIQI